jgi:hypothetical protein
MAKGMVISGNARLSAAQAGNDQAGLGFGQCGDERVQREIRAGGKGVDGGDDEIMLFQGIEVTR